MTGRAGHAGFLMHDAWHTDIVVAHRFELAGGMPAPAIARAEVGAALGRLVAADDLRDIAVLVSEIVTNAVRHAGAGEHDTIVVHLAISADVLRVEVCDHGPGFAPPARPRRRSDGGGNGLVLLGLMSSSWGLTTDDGTCVWFERPITRRG